MKTRIKALLMAAIFCLTFSVSNAQSDSYFFNWNDYREGSDDPTAPIIPQSHGDENDSAAPLGSGVTVLVALGAMYALRKKVKGTR